MSCVRVLTAFLFLIAASEATVLTGDTPSAALERLKAGNARFVKDAASSMPIDEARRQAQTQGQSPFAIVLSCADSRVPPEIIFNAGLGELFVVRTAGGVADKAVLASIEYGAEHLKAPLLVVMGHESCGAVKAAVETKPGGPSMGPNLDALIGAIRPSFDRMAASADLAHLREAILANVEQEVNDVLGRSAIVKRLVTEGELLVIGAYYEFSTGLVRFSEPVRLGAGAPKEGAATTPPGAHKVPLPRLQGPA
jgi:carbonic anhydrase